MQYTKDNFVMSLLIQVTRGDFEPPVGIIHSLIFNIPARREHYCGYELYCEQFLN